MQKEKDYDVAIAKIPRTDRNGNDITEDKLGGGGRHRADGTISGMAYDFKIIDEERFFEIDRAERVPKFSTKDMLKAYLIENLLIPVVDCFFDEMEYHAEIFLADKVLPAVKRKGKELIANTKPVLAGIWDGIRGKETRAEQILKEHEKRKTALVVSNMVEENKDENNVEFVTSAEERRIITNMRCYAILLANEIQRYSKICVINKYVDSDEYIEERQKFEKLMTQDTMNGIQSLLENKELFCLDEMAVRILAEFHAGNVIWEGKCVPIPNFLRIERK